MNKAELIELIGEKTGAARKEVEGVIDSMLDIITEKIKDGKEVTLTGFGAFSARARKGRIGVNPRNPEQKIEIPSVVVPKFKAGKNLKEALKGKKSAPAATPAVAEPAPVAKEPAPAASEPAAEEPAA